MPADTLVEMAQRACIRYSGRITDVGDLSYELVRPVLLKIESPEKLHQIEQASPQLIGRVGEMWLNFIKRDIPDWETKRHEPKDPKNWYKVYRKLRQEAQEAISQGEDKLKAALANIQIEKEQNLAQLVSRRDLPRQSAGRRQQITYDYISGRTGSKGAHKMSLMEKIRKESRGARSAKMSKPMHELRKQATVVTQPPRQFVDELRAKPTAPHTQMQSAGRIRPPRPPLGAPKPKPSAMDSSYDITEDREARLRALKAGKPAPIRNPEEPQRPTSRPSVATGLSSGFLEDLEDGPDSNQLLTAPSPAMHRTGSPMRISSPQPGGLKRKQAPSLFMASPAKKVMRKPEMSR